MSTLRNAVDVLIFSLCLPLFLLSSTTTSHTNEASSEPIRAPLREVLLEAGAAQLLHPAPGEGRVLVESPEVPVGGIHTEGHTPTPHGLPWEHWLLRCALKSEATATSTRPWCEWTATDRLLRVTSMPPCMCVSLCWHCALCS